MATAEGILQGKIRAALCKDGTIRAFRNNTGVCRDNWVRYGLAVGSADLICIIAPMGRFCSLEVKTPKGIISDEQYIWQKTIREFGGVAEFVRSVADALEVVRKVKAGEL